MNKILIIIFFVVSFFSCKNEQSNSIKVNTYKFMLEDKDEIKTLSPDSIFSSVRYIKLETTDESVIKEIDKISFDDHFIYIYDSAKRSVLLFSLDGRYIRSLNKIGGAENEYISLNDYYVEDNLLYVLCRDNKAIKIYQIPDLEFVKTIRLDDFYSKFSFSANNIYLYSDFSSSDLKNITILDRKTTNKIISYKTFPETRLGEGFHEDIFFNYDDTIYATFPYEYSICKLNNDIVNELINFDFGKSNMLPSFLEKSSMSEINEYRRKITMDKWPILGIENFFRTDTNYFFSFIYKSSNHSVIYNIHDSTLIYGYIYQTQKYPLCTPEMKFYHNGYVLQDIKSNWIPATLKVELGKNIPEYLHTVSEDDNPVIGIYELKEKFR